MVEPVITRLSHETPNVHAILDGITHIHGSCIEHDKTAITFLPPLSHTKILKWWRRRFGEVMAGEREIWVELAPVSSRNNQLASPLIENKPQSIRIDQDPDQDYEVAGVIALSLPVTETGSFRGEVSIVLVSPNHRQKGISKRLMAVLEQTALKEGRWNIMLSTEVGNPAEQIYQRMGYKRVGVVPDYSYRPFEGGGFRDEVWLYKDLRKGTL